MKTESQQMPLAQPSNAGVPPADPKTGEAASQAGRTKSKGARHAKTAHKKSDQPKLCWNRRELAQAASISYRTIVNLERRGLLKRVPAGINVALYSDASVRALFGEPTAPIYEGT